MADGYYLEGRWTRDVWAIELRVLKDDRALAGVGMFSWPDKPHLQGCRIALFDTRREAREHLPSVKNWRPKARVVPVTITVQKRDGHA